MNGILSILWNYLTKTLNVWCSIWLCVVSVGCGDDVGSEIRILSNGTRDEKIKAINYFIKLSERNPEKGLSPFINLLNNSGVDDDDKNIYLMGMMMICNKIGENAICALPTLRKTLASGLATGKFGLIEKSIRSIGFIGPPAINEIPILFDICKHENPEFRMRAARAIITIDPSEKRKIELLPILINEIDVRSDATLLAVILLGECGSVAKSAIPVLERIYNGSERDTKNEAKKAIANINK